MILTTHSMEEAEILCDRVSWLKKGNFVCIGVPEKLKIQYSMGYKLHVKFNDNEILEKCDCFIKRNYYYNKCFKKLNIKTYDLSSDYQLKMKEIVNDLKKEFINEKLEIIIDRPLGSKHPKYEMIYEVNYGYLPNTKSDDGEEIDCYLLGVDKPVDRFIGRCIGIVRRTNDNDDKFIIVPVGVSYTDKEIERLINFQEKYFEHILIR